MRHMDLEVLHLDGYCSNLQEYIMLQGNPGSVGIKLSFYLFILVNFIGMWAGSKVEIQKQYRRAGGTKTEIQVKKEVYKKTILESIGTGIVFIILYFVFNNI